MAMRPALRRVIPWGMFAAVLGATGLLWYGPPTRGTQDKSEAGGAGTAEAAIDTSSLIVDFKDDVSDEALARNGYVEVPISDYSAKDRLYRINFASAGAAAAAAAKLARDPDVESVDPDVQATLPPDEIGVRGGSSMEVECSASAAKPSEDPNDPCFRYQWHLRQIGLPGAWKMGQGKGVVVAVIDTGVTRVADLAETPFVPGYNFIGNNANADDDHGHGTHVAGTIAESTNNKLGVAGVAYGVSIMPIKVLSAQGSGSMGGIAQGIRWAADHGANVINMSLGGSMPVGTIASASTWSSSSGAATPARRG